MYVSFKRFSERERDMFSELIKNEIENRYNERCEKYASVMEMVNEKIQGLDITLGMLLKYIYGSVTVADMAETEFDVFLDYAVQGMFLWKSYERVQLLPERLFLEYVVNPCVKNEEIDICRTAFYHLFFKYYEEEERFWKKDETIKKESLKEYLDEMTENEIVDAVNFWCASEAAFENIVGRCVSAKTVFATAVGNKEELAVFFVNALRSMGIPARLSSEEIYDNKNIDGNSEDKIFISVFISGEWCVKTVCEPWYDILSEYMDETEKKKLTAKKARAQGSHFVKKKRWKNDEREKFFFGDIFTMNMRAKLLKIMSEKDQLDMKYEVMEEHFKESCPKEEWMDEEFYISYILNPRISNEVIRPWKKTIKDMFTEEDINCFKDNPLLILEEINSRFDRISDDELGRRYLSPYGSLKLGKISEISEKILFAAIARTVGIAARICENDMDAEYWDGEKFCAV